MMRIGKRAGIAALALVATLAACNGGGSAGGTQKGAETRGQAQADSARDEAKALRDSGVSVDTQTIDTGTAAAQQPVDN